MLYIAARSAMISIVSIGAFPTYAGKAVSWYMGWPGWASCACNHLTKLRRARRCGRAGEGVGKGDPSWTGG
eukprot:357318-Chlamydomonas_euryale.AAC.2